MYTLIKLLVDLTCRIPDFLLIDNLLRMQR
jgi:hypothetical protein